jgi:hypothetical protein
MKMILMGAILLCGSAQANGLDDLKAALSPLQGHGALRGAYEVRETRTDLARGGKGPETTQASALVEEDASGLSIRWERSLLRKAADESSPAKGAGKKEALSALIAQSSAPRLSIALNYAPRLLQSLFMSQYRSERTEQWQGRPTRVVEVLISPQEVPNESVNIKENTIVAQFWLGADGVPLAASTVHTVKAKFMVFMSYEKTTREEFSFATMSNRLVVLKRDSQGKEKGPGIDNTFQNLYTFTPKG